MFPFFRRKVQPKSLVVHYDTPPIMPRGVTALAWHKPVGSGEVVLWPQQLRLIPLEPGQSYQWFRLNNPDLTFADANVLDALIHTLFLRDERISEVAVKAFLGDFCGQMFFLNTAFHTSEGECHAFLNWNTHLPALRYVCPATNPINHDVNCCACVIEG